MTKRVVVVDAVEQVPSPMSEFQSPTDGWRWICVCGQDYRERSRDDCPACGRSKWCKT